MPLQTRRRPIACSSTVVVLLLLVIQFEVAGQAAPVARAAVTSGGAPRANPLPSTNPEDDESDIRIIQALDKQINLNVADAGIRDVVQQISAAAGVPIELEPAALDLLPYGSKTLLTATVEHRPAREVLTRLLRQLGLAFRAEKTKVLIVPTEPLRRIARRATWEELGLLEKLSSTPWSKELFDSLQFQFQDARAGYADANRERLWELAGAVGVGTGAEVLEHACDKYGWCWAPSGNVITILSKTRQVEKFLNKRVTVRYNQTSVERALLDLANQAGVLLQIDPGALASLPAQTADRFTLSLENQTVRQALEVIAGQTGLSYSIEPSGVRIAANTTTAPSATDITTAAELAAKAARSNSVVGQITIPNPDGTSFSFFIRENDLPAEVNKMRTAKIKGIIKQFEQALSAEQPKK